MQLTAPGIAIRRAHIESVVGVPKDSFLDLLTESIAQSFRIVYDAEVFAGFLLLLLIGLYAMLTSCQPVRAPTIPGAPPLTRPPLLIGLATQLLLIPLLYSHLSDNPQVLGRFSVSYATALTVNALLLVCFAALLVGRRRINRFFVIRRIAPSVIAVPLLLSVLGLFVMTQLRAIHWRALSYLLISAQILLFVTIWQLLGSAERWKRLATICAPYGIFVAVNALVILSQLYNGQKLIPRSLTLVPYGMALNGLLWGLVLGYAVRQWNAACELRIKGWAALRWLSLFAAIALAISMAGRNAQLIGPFETFAREWDARQDHIIAQREQGLRMIVVEPMTFDMEGYLTQITPFHMVSDAARYYGVDAIGLDDT